MVSEHKRSLGFWRSWSLVVGSVIGSAIFMMPAVLAPYGGLGLVSWLMSAIGAIIVALMFGHLSRRITKVGGPYAYAHAGFGNFGGFLVAWGYWISVWVACAAIAIGFVAYLGFLIPALADSPGLSAGVGVAVIWLLIGVNYLGVREAGIMGLVTTLMKIVPLLLVIAFGFFHIEPGSFPAFNPSGGSAMSGFFVAAALTFWSFVGLDAATVPTEDVIEPKKTIPRALIFGTLTIAVIYLLTGLVVMMLIPGGTLANSTSPIADAAVVMVGGWGGVFVAIGAMVSTFGALNCAILTNSQTAMAAARDGVFPARFAELSANHTPGFSLFATGFLASAVLVMNYTKGLVGAYTFVLLLATMTTVVPYAFSAMAGLILDVHDPETTARQRVWEVVVAIVAFLVCMFVIASSGADAVYWGFLLLMAGIPVYVVVTRNKTTGSE